MTDTRPVYADPRFDARDPQLTYAEQEPAAARWDLAFGCNLSFGPLENGTPLRVSVSMSDHEHAAGMCVRIVSPEQVYAFAQHLIRLVAKETGKLRCRTNMPGAHGYAIVLIDGEPRCELCAEHVAADDPRRAPLPELQREPKLSEVSA